MGDIFFFAKNEKFILKENDNLEFLKGASTIWGTTINY